MKSTMTGKRLHKPMMAAATALLFVIGASAAAFQNASKAESPSMVGIEQAPLAGDFAEGDCSSPEWGARTSTAPEGDTDVAGTGSGHPGGGAKPASGSSGAGDSPDSASPDGSARNGSAPPADATSTDSSPSDSKMPPTETPPAGDGDPRVPPHSRDSDPDCPGR